MVIRQAQIEDIKRVAEIQVASWQSAFRGIIPDDFLDQLNVNEREVGWLKNIQNYPGNLIVSEDELGVIQGFLCVGPISNPNHPDFAGEIFAIHIEPMAKRKGYGQCLMRAAFERVIGLGYKNIMLWTPEENNLARNFYEKLGGKILGRKTKNIGGRDFVEIAYGWYDVAQYSWVIAP